MVKTRFIRIFSQSVAERPLSRAERPLRELSARSGELSARSGRDWSLILLKKPFLSGI